MTPNIADLPKIKISIPSHLILEATWQFMVSSTATRYIRYAKQLSDQIPPLEESPELISFLEELWKGKGQLDNVLLSLLLCKISKETMLKTSCIVAKDFFVKALVQEKLKGRI